MKKISLALLLLVSFAVSAQNKLNDLYTLTPPGMPHVQKWVNTTLRPVFIRNLQSSDNARSASKFLLFTLGGRPGTALSLPNTGGLLLLPAAGQISAKYDQEILNYLRSFDVAGFDYSHQAYFLMAGDVLRMVPNQFIAQTLNYFIENDFKHNIDKYNVFIDDVNKKMKVHLPYPTEKSVTALATVLQQQYPNKIRELIFDTYIKGKTDDQTRINIQHFYNITGFFRGPVEDRLDEMMNPAITWSQNVPQSLLIPSGIIKLAGATTDSPAVFHCKTINAVLNYHKKQLEIKFNGQFDKEALAPNGKLMDYNDKTKKFDLLPLTGQLGKPNTYTDLNLIISETGLQLIGNTAYGRHLLADQKWAQ
jgi:hypothetical protein